MTKVRAFEDRTSCRLVGARPVVQGVRWLQSVVRGVHVVAVRSKMGASKCSPLTQECKWAQPVVSGVEEGAVRSKRGPSGCSP